MPPADALQFLLKGDQISANRAKAMKLVDEVVPAGDLVKAAKAWIATSGTAKAPWDIENFKLPGGPVQSKAGMMAFTPANAHLSPRDLRQLSGSARHHAGGLRGTATADGSGTARRVALVRENPALAGSGGDDPLAVRLDAGDQQRRAPPGRGAGARNSKTIGVLGAGFMGAGIAYVSALAGLDVVLVDRDPETAEKGKAHSQKLMSDQVSRGRATAADRDAVLARIKPTADFVELKDCDLVIEAVFEDRKIKEEVIARAQNVIGEKTIFGSNTSTLPITSLADAFKDRSRFIGIHFFSPVERMNLVEIILGKETGEVALAGALDYVRAIRKTPIVVNDSRGFYTSRVVGTYLREGHLMLADGVPAAMIENVGRMAGMPVGPLALNDEVAVDLAWKILKATEADLGAARDRSAAEGAARRHGGKARPLRAQERQGLLRLSAERAEAAVARARRFAADTSSIPTRSILPSSKRGCWRSRRWNPRAASRRASSPTCAKPMSARSSASALRLSPAAPSPISTAWARKAFVALCSKLAKASRRPLQALQALARHGEKGRDVLPPLPAAGAPGRRMSRVKVALRFAAPRV